MIAWIYNDDYNVYAASEKEAIEVLARIMNKGLKDKNKTPEEKYLIPIQEYDVLYIHTRYDDLLVEWK